MFFFPTFSSSFLSFFLPLSPPPTVPSMSCSWLFWDQFDSTWTGSPSSAPHWLRAELPPQRLADGGGVPSAWLAVMETLTLAPCSVLTCCSTLKLQALTLCTVCERVSWNSSCFLATAAERVQQVVRLTDWLTSSLFIFTLIIRF